MSASRARTRAKSHAGLLLLAAAMSFSVAGACSAPPDATTGGDTPPISTAVGPVPGPPTSLPTRTNPYSNDRAAMGEGRKLFVRFNCSGCHGGRAGGGMGPSLRDIDWIYGNQDAQIFSSIAEGRAHGMPTWAPRLSGDQIWKLVTYIKSLRTSNEPQRPVE